MGQNNLRELRRAAGMTQAALAEAARINVVQIQRMEAGKISMENITLGNALRLAEALNVAPDDLLGDKTGIKQQGPPPD